MRIAQRIKAPNDVNGNPRRAYLIYKVTHDKYAKLEAVYDEGYAGMGEKYPDAIFLVTIDVSATEYKAFIKIGKDCGIYQGGN